MAQVLAPVVVGYLAGQLISAGAHAILESSRPRQRRLTRRQIEEEYDVLSWVQPVARRPVTVLEELESEDRSILQTFPETDVECKLCMTTTTRDGLCLRTCRTQADDVSDVFACVREHPICYDCSERLRTQPSNRCPFCRQDNVFRKPRALQAIQAEAAAPALRRFWEEGEPTSPSYGTTPQHEETLQEEGVPGAQPIYKELSDKLIFFYQVFRPWHSVQHAEVIARKYYGREQTLNQELRTKYGYDLITARRGCLAAWLDQFYALHNLAQQRFAAEVAADFEGREEELNALLRAKYGVDLSSLRSTRPRLW